MSRQANRAQNGKAAKRGEKKKKEKKKGLNSGCVISLAIAQLELQSPPALDTFPPETYSGLQLTFPADMPSLLVYRSATAPCCFTSNETTQLSRNELIFHYPASRADRSASSVSTQTGSERRRHHTLWFGMFRNRPGHGNPRNGNRMITGGVRIEELQEQ